MPVICTGRKLGRVSSVSLTDDLGQLKGIWMDCGLHGSRFIDRSRLDMLGEVAVLTRDEGVRRRCTEKPLMRRALSTDGRRVGAITDAMIDESTLDVCALELSFGYYDDLMRGRQCIWHYTVSKTGEVILDETRPEGGNS